MIEQKWPNEIFEEKNLYKYLFENQEDPNIIEKDLAEFEREASEVIKPFKENYSVSLDFKKNELLKYFFFIMMMRSKFMTATYNKDIFNHNRKSKLSAEELDEFYKKNLGIFVKYRSLEKAAIDKKFNVQFFHYAFDVIFGITGKHFVLFQSGDKIDFVLGDAYPIGIGKTINIFKALSLTSFIFPISYNRAIALTDTYSEFHVNIKQFKIYHKDRYENPKKIGIDDLIQVKYLSDEQTININKGILKGTIDGICFRSDRRTGIEEMLI